VTSTAIWRVGRITSAQRQRTLELVTQVQEARRDVEEAAKVADLQSTRLRNMAGELIRENEEALKDAHDHAPQPRGR